MVLGIITVGAIGITYLTGDRKRKDKMKKIGFGIVDVTKDVAGDIVDFTKNIMSKIKENNQKNNNL